MSSARWCEIGEGDRHDACPELQIFTLDASHALAWRPRRGTRERQSGPQRRNFCSAATHHSGRPIAAAADAACKRHGIRSSKWLSCTLLMRSAQANYKTGDRPPTSRGRSNWCESLFAAKSQACGPGVRGRRCPNTRRESRTPTDGGVMISRSADSCA